MSRTFELLQRTGKSRSLFEETAPATEARSDGPSETARLPGSLRPSFRRTISYTFAAVIGGVILPNGALTAKYSCHALASIYFPDNRRDFIFDFRTQEGVLKW